MTNDTRSRFTFRIPENLIRVIKDYSREKGMSVNATILQILWDWVKTKSA